LQAKRDVLNTEIERLIKPALTDRSFIPTIYEWFKDILSYRDCPPRPETPYQRKKFLFIILVLYNPGFFIGERMVMGLRRDISVCIKMNEESVIFANCADVRFIYEQYKDFKNDVDVIYQQIAERLKDYLNSNFLIRQIFSSYLCLVS
jgi:hypothetical protein